MLFLSRIPGTQAEKQPQNDALNHLHRFISGFGACFVVTGEQDILENNLLGAYY